jgi:branched-chain amino acid aminotransferase
MMPNIEDLYTFINGEFVTDKDAVIPIHDKGFTSGDAVFDTARTFSGKVYKLKEHVDRFFMSLNYMQIKSPYTKEELIKYSQQLLDMNVPLLDKNEDYWIFLRITRGAVNKQGENVPNVIIHCTNIPFKQRANFYDSGMPIIFSSVRRTAHDALSPRAKVNQYINFTMADLEVHNIDKNAKAVLLDKNGNITEGSGANIFIVKNNEIFTPREQFVLAGIGRSDAMGLAKGLGMTLTEKDLDTYDAFTADEIFITSTSFCIVPVGTVNGRQVGEADVPGKVTKRLQDAFIDSIGFDYVNQYLQHLSA